MDYYSREYVPGEYDAEEYLEAAQMIDPETDFSDWSMAALRDFVDQHQDWGQVIPQGIHPKL